MERSTINDRFGIRGAVHAPPGVVVVAIDDKTFSDLRQQWPFPRNLHAEVIDRLRADGARVIAYDVQFTEPSSPPRDDLTSTTRSAARATSCWPPPRWTSTAGPTSSAARPTSAPAHAVAAAANLPADAGGIIRRYASSILGLPSFAAPPRRPPGTGSPPTASPAAAP